MNDSLSEKLLMQIFYFTNLVVGKIFLGLNGIIWSITAAQILTSLIGLGLWIHFKKDPSMKDPSQTIQYH